MQLIAARDIQMEEFSLMVVIQVTGERHINAMRIITDA
jgi:hypothetical protein